MLLTQKLALQPRLEANPLRYEIRREFAPYVGIEWAGKYGATADSARATGDDTRETRVVAGLRFWY